MSDPRSRDPSGADRFRWNAVRESAGAYYRANPIDRIAIIRGRVPATYVIALTESMQIPKERLTTRSTWPARPSTAKSRSVSASIRRRASAFWLSCG
jgi:hypothetical protein